MTEKDREDRRKQHDASGSRPAEGDDPGGCAVRLILSPEWHLIGLRGQHLGTVGRCIADLSSGRLLEVEVHTPWQRLPVQWSRIEVDKEQRLLRLRPEH